MHTLTGKSVFTNDRKWKCWRRVALTELGWAAQAHTLAILKQKPKLTTFFENVCHGGGWHSEPQSYTSVPANWPSHSLSANSPRLSVKPLWSDAIFHHHTRCKCNIWILHPLVAQLCVKELCVSVSHFISYKMSQIITPHLEVWLHELIKLIFTHFYML